MKIQNAIPLTYYELLEWITFKKGKAIKFNFGMKNLKLISYWPVKESSILYICVFESEKI